MSLTPTWITADTMSSIREKTAKDPVLQKVVLSPWPSGIKKVPDEIRAYWSLRDEISVYDDVLYKSYKVIVPASLRPGQLQKIQRAHQGTKSSIWQTRESISWPGMQAAVRETWLSCGVCAQYLSERPREPMKSHYIPSRHSPKWAQINSIWMAPITLLWWTLTVTTWN